MSVNETLAQGGAAFSLINRAMHYFTTDRTHKEHYCYGKSTNNIDINNIDRLDELNLSKYFIICILNVLL